MILNQFPHSSGASEDSIHVAESLNGPWTHGRMLESEPTTASSCHAEGRRGAGAQGQVLRPSLASTAILVHLTAAWNLVSTRRFGFVGHITPFFFTSISNAFAECRRAPVLSEVN